VTEAKGSSFWATVPGLITAIAGMITAVAILITTLAPLLASDPQASGVPPGSPGTSAVVGPTDSGLASAGASSSPDDGSPGASASVAPTPVPILFYAVRVDPETSVDNADLYAVDPATGTERRLTTDARPDSYPAWSPDGTRIAFDSRRGDGNRNLWVLEADGSYTALTDDARDDAYATWSPEGSQVAWAAGTAGAREIWVMDARAGTDARRVTTGGDDYLPSWSSTGLIAFERRVSSGSEVWVVDPAGGGAVARITTADGGGGDPAWSPDGRKLVFTRRSGGIDQVFVAAADGQSGLLELTPAATCDCDEPAWSPDGSQVVYVGPGSGVIRPIMVIDAAGGTARRITTNGLGPSWGG
jgi:Tol biopolymer transport system component